jgi:hypothetical protein
MAGGEDRKMKPSQKKQAAAKDDDAEAVTQIEAEPGLPEVRAGIEGQPRALLAMRTASSVGVNARGLATSRSVSTPCKLPSTRKMTLAMARRI